MIGQTLGPYRVLDKLGEGGMGEVYRARDTRLDRDVAIKVLPAAFTADPDRRARFEREAKVLAALNHPNIAQVYGFEDYAIAMELVDGPTLADRIARGPLPLSDALPIARQIADALEAAHDAGIVHRDLKPANIKLKGAWGPTPTRLPDGRLESTLSAADVAGCTVKVLDFGLAKALVPDAASGDAVNSPTMTSPAMTQRGIILGTAAYMAPEQARGRAIDKRADIWAFGAVLFEMLTGRPAFAGESVTDTLAAVVRGEPDWTTLPADTPASIRRLLRRCLVKDHRHRLGDMSGARLDIADALDPAPDADRQTPASPPPSRARWYERAALAVALAALLVATPLVVRHLSETPVAPATVRLTIEPPDGLRLASAGVVSPDGRLVAFRANRLGETTSRLWVRPLDALEARELPGTDGNFAAPCWSPDSRAIAFGSANGIRRIDLGGGPVQTVTNVPANSCAWGPDGTIIFQRAQAGGVLWRVQAAGGQPVALTSLDTAANEDLHVAPHFLPDGRRFLFLALSGSAAGAPILLGSLDTAERTRVIENVTAAVYVPPGYLMFRRENTLMVQPFDVARGTVRGEAVPVLTDVGSVGAFSVSSTGVLAYRPVLAPATPGGRLVWVDRQGRDTPVPALTMDRVEYPRLSPDGRRLAFVANGDIWVGDLTGRPPIRLTFDGSESPLFSPLWTPDGQHLVYEISQNSRTGGGLWSLPADGSTVSATRVGGDGHFHPHGWSADGGELVAVSMGPSNSDIVALPFGAPGDPRPVVATPAAEGSAGASLSPDGRWLAYTANPTGAMEIWVRPYPGPGAPIRVSPDGGLEPVWSRDGRALFYRQASRLLSVAVQPGAEFRFDPPVLVFESSEYGGGGQPPRYDVAPDGRFLILMLKRQPAAEPAAELPPLVVVFNWLAEFERRGR